MYASHDKTILEWTSMNILFLSTGMLEYILWAVKINLIVEVPHTIIQLFIGMRAGGSIA
jgi:hypothetical protein